MIPVLLLIPVFTVATLWFTKNCKMMHAINIFSSFIMAFLAFYLSVQVYLNGALNNYYILRFYLDSLSIIVLDIVLFIGFMVSIYSVGYLNTEKHHGVFDTGSIRLFYILSQSFFFTMILSLTTENLGIMWIGIEATTLSSAFLVGFYNNKKSIEAAWKYVIICSVGIALALLGIIFLHLSSMDIVKDTHFELSWTYLVSHAGELQKSTLRLSFIFILIGFGTKSGLAPMHTWLPDAHSQAPSPISALLSGVLLNSAMYGIMRELAIVNRSIGTEFASRLLLGIGILSVLTAALFIITQKDYKRLLAYSSIEHMGIIAWGLGLFTPASVLASIMHMLNHSFTKSMLFLSSGNVFLKFKTKEINKVTGLLKVMPVTGTIFLLGIFAITGMPPFSVFTSEFGILVATFKALPIWISVIFVLLIASVFVGFAVALLKMFYGEPGELDSCKISKISTAVLAALFIIILVTGLFIPGQVMDTFIRAQKIVTGG